MKTTFGDCKSLDDEQRRALLRTLEQKEYVAQLNAIMATAQSPAPTATDEPVLPDASASPSR